MSNNWKGKSITERVHWYNNELNSLFEYLSGKNPLKEEHIRIAEPNLENIKALLREDRKSISSVDKVENDHIYFIDSAGLALEELEAIESDFSNWQERIGRANKIFIYLKDR